MRETFKSLSIFSASLLLLLVIASGCVVNIPGCGKYQLPLFQKVQGTQNEASAPATTVAPLEAPVQTTAESSPAPVAAAPNSPAAVAPAPAAVKSPVPAAEKEIAFEQPKTPTPQFPAAAPANTPTVTPTPTPWEVERIAYTTEEEGKVVLCTMNPDGTGRIRHTPLGSNVYWPLWSPNGEVLAFLSDMVEGKLNLFVMKKENQSIQQLTFFDDMGLPRTKALKPPITWSPRGDQIAFIYKSQVWIANSLIPDTPESLAVTDPLYSIVAVEWAPRRDNKYIAYLVEEGEKNYSLWLVNPRLKDKARIAQMRDAVSCFTWVSDAIHLNYVSGALDVNQCAYESFVQKPILLNPAASIGPLISCVPVENSTTFLVLAKKANEKTWRVAVIDKPSAGQADTGSLKYLTDPGADYATWSPDGTRIAYLADNELWVMDNAGGNKKRVAVSGILQPAWSRK